jgi:hypothetical protein
MANVSRREFAAAVVSTAAITSDSVPADPDAPSPGTGTQPEQTPFGQQIEFMRRDVPSRVEPFTMTDVRLLPGAFHEAQEANRKFLGELPPDRLLHVFRLNAGLPSTAVPLGGWEKPDCELRGHFVGHYLSACALIYSSTGDPEMRARGEELVSELAKCQARLPGGYLSAFPTGYFDRLKARKKVWAPFYTLHKIMAGMLDMHQHCGSRQALTVLTGMANWADSYSAAMPEAHMQMVLDTEYGGMNEVLYNLAALSNDARFARAGDRFTRKRFFNPLALRRDELRGLHVNTHIPQVVGAARRYEISGDQRFRDVAEYFWQTVSGTRTYGTAGTSNNEHWLTSPNQLAAELAMGYDTNECCCSYNMLKLARKLYSWSGDPRFFDYYERALFNHRLGTINADGATQYYLGIAPGSWRTFATKFDSFWCCNGTAVEEYSKLNDSIYFHDANGIYINLFIPSELNWKQKNFQLRQETKFPDEPRGKFVVHTDAPATLTLHVRVPAWVAGIPTLKINRKESDVSASPGSYVSITRTWQTGDEVEIELPTGLRYESMPDDRSLRAILYGPLLLAGELGSAGLTPELEIGPEGPNLKKYPAPPIPSFRANKQVSEWIQPGDGPLTFRTQGQTQNVTFRPFYRVSEQRYSIYWHITDN